MHRTVARLLIAFAVVGFVVLLAVFGSDYARVPAVVPTHFAFDGTPNAWGSRSTFIILPLVGALMLALATIAGLVGLPGSRTPVPEWLPTIVCAVFTEMVWIFVFTEIGSFDVALGATTRLNSTIMVAGLGAIMLTAGAVVFVAIRAAFSRDA
jgi:hypothetical protein